MTPEKLVWYLLLLLAAYFICYLLYALILSFIETTKQHKVFNKNLKLVEKQIEDTINNLIGEQLNQEYDDLMYDKTDEELLEDWNNLWGGNPPCELDLKAIREEEQLEQKNKE